MENSAMSNRALLALLLLCLSLLTLPAWIEPALSAQDKGEASDPQIPKELAPRLITLEEKDLPLSSALAALAKQTGNHVEDRRKDKDDPKLRLQLRKATF